MKLANWNRLILMLLVCISSLQCSEDPELAKIKVVIFPDQPRVYTFPTTIPDPFPNNEIDESRPLEKNWFSFTFDIENTTAKTITIYSISLTITGQKNGFPVEATTTILPHEIDRDLNGSPDQVYIASIAPGGVHDEDLIFYIQQLPELSGHTSYRIFAEFDGIYDVAGTLDAESFNKRVSFSASE